VGIVLFNNNNSSGSSYLRLRDLLKGIRIY
jgi:hypothetical protein